MSRSYCECFFCSRAGIKPWRQHRKPSVPKRELKADKAERREGKRLSKEEEG